MRRVRRAMAAIQQAGNTGAIAGQEARELIAAVMELVADVEENGLEVEIDTSDNPIIEKLTGGNVTLRVRIPVDKQSDG